MAPDLPTIAADELDDLIYYSRAGDLSSLKESIEALTGSYSSSSAKIIRAAIDVDEEGLGSRACLLHYPSANGSLEIVQYLLSQFSVESQDQSQSSSTAETSTRAANSTPNQSGPEYEFVNHQNVSGNTPLHWAGMNGHLEVVKVLIKAGANPELVNAAGRDAVVESEWSSKDGAADCAVWILNECGALEKGVGMDGTDGNDGPTNGEEHEPESEDMDIEGDGSAGTSSGVNGTKG